MITVTMMTSYLTLALFLPALAVGASMKLPDNMVDMTHNLVEKMPAFPGHTPYEFDINVRGEYPLLKNPDIYIELNTIRLSEHTATHVDAPSHFINGGWRMHQIPNENWIGPGVVIDITDKAEKNPDAEVSMEDVRKYEEKYGQIPNRAFVFQNSGWEKFWMNKTAFLGAGSAGQTTDTKSFHWPGFSLEVTKFLVEERDILGIGSDTISFEVATTKDFPVHSYLLGKRRLGFEMVANLTNVPPAGTTVYAFPMKIYDGSGAPVRMFAMWSNACLGLRPSFLVVSLMTVVIMLWIRK